MRSLEDIEIGPPSEPHSGLFPTVRELPLVPDTSGLRLRRAVLMIVVIGGMGLVAYASWQRMGYERAASSAEASAPALSRS